MKKITIWVIVTIIIIGASVIAIVSKRDDGSITETTTETVVNVVKTEDISENPTRDPAVIDPAIKIGKQFSDGQCEGGEKPPITHAPMDLADFSMIIPYGLMVSSHVTPIDHQYFEPADRSLGADSYPVYAVAEATLINISTRPSGAPGGSGTEYRLVFSMSCKLFYYYDLVTSLAPDIEAEFNSRGGRSINIKIKAGQTIGRIGGQTLDFAVWDMEVMLPGFITPRLYEREPWKIHTADPLDYYTEQLKKMLVPKYVRTVEPISGKIDYDIDGKLIGNWFVQNTNGYAGVPDASGNYASTHLSISPDHIDPSTFIVSIGNWPDQQSNQFGVAGNSPDPATVDVSTGIVKYQLVNTSYQTPNGRQWNYDSVGESLSLVEGLEQRGCTLAQLMDDRLLKFESFPGQSCDAIADFTDNALLYER